MLLATFPFELMQKVISISSFILHLFYSCAISRNVTYSSAFYLCKPQKKKEKNNTDNAKTNKISSMLSEKKLLFYFFFSTYHINFLKYFLDIDQSSSHSLIYPSHCNYIKCSGRSRETHCLIFSLSLRVLQRFTREHAVGKVLRVGLKNCWN